jgi:hypothetical protein
MDCYLEDLVERVYDVILVYLVNLTRISIDLSEKLVYLQLVEQVGEGEWLEVETGKIQ